jgi:two-component system chemotaxis response regulator CheY
LVVEDSAVMRQLMGRAIDGISEVEGWDEAEDGIQALRKLADGEYALVIVDLNLPVLDGLKLIERIRKEPGRAATKIVVVTTDSNAEDRRRAMELGADAYLLKPIQLQDLRNAIARTLDSSA